LGLCIREQAKMNLISVIIVNFNAGPLLIDCVRSVLSSTLPVEVIVSDNQSQDASIAGLRRAFAGEARLKIIENAGNLGFAKANNRAIPFSRGDFILFLNPDSVIRPDTLARMLEAMRTHPKAGMAGCLIRNPDGSEQAGCRRSVPTPWRTFIRLAKLSVLAKYHPRFESYVQTGLPMPEQPVAVEAISGAFMLVRRSAMEAVGVMDEGYFMHCEDLDWCMRFHQARLDILFVPGVEILHIGGVCSSSRPVSVEYYKHKGMVRFYQKFFRRQYPAMLMWLVLTAIWTRFLLRVAAHLFAKPRRAEPMPPEAPVSLKSLSPLQPPAGAPRRTVLVTGASSLIGDYLLPGLVESGCEAHAFSRNPPGQPRLSSLHWHRLDITQEHLGDAFGADTLIHLAPLWTLPPLIKGLAVKGVKRVIAFGSTSVFTKFQSSYAKERLMAHGLKDSEERLAELCAGHGMEWTVFRPTLVYRLGRDKNVTTIAQFIRRFGFFPLVGSGEGLRQPVHAEDLALACIKALDNPRTFGKAYNLSGGETLTYREMVGRISKSQGRNAQVITIPLPAFRVFLRGLSWLPIYRHLTPEMANRINLDMCFDHAPATRDIGFNPRPFLAGEARQEDLELLQASG
jgi:GT2 family glycosyltransferase/nucleoside-diphosphate-sugar epimerase